MKHLFIISLFTLGTIACTTQNPNTNSENKVETINDTTSTVAEKDVFEGLVDTIIPIAGTCSSCKKGIEKAANSVAGIEAAVWTLETKTLRVGAKDSLNLIAVIDSVQAAGYMLIQDSVSTEENDTIQ